MKKLIITLILFISGTYLFTGCSEDTDPDIISASGTIEATDITISPKTSGNIKRILVNEGDRVKTGDVIAEIDHDLLDIQLRQAEANSDVALAQLRLLQSGARKEDIGQARENVIQTEINMEQAKNDMERMTNLYNSQSITKKQYEDAVTKYEITRAQYNSANENLKKVRTIIRPEEIETAQANYRRNVAAADIIRKNIEDCIIHSPADGIVSKKFVEPGELVNPSGSIIKISDLDKVNLVIYLPETDLGKVKPGQTAEINTDTYPDKIYKGKITFLSPEAEFTPKNIQTQDERTKLVFAIKIEIPNPALELKPGMPADAKVYIKQ